MSESVFVSLVTRPDVPNANGHVYSREACEEAVRQLNTKEYFVTRGYPKDGDAGSVDLRHVCGASVPGSAKLEDDRIQVSVTLFDEKIANGLRDGSIVVGGAYITAPVWEKERWYVRSASLVHLATFPKDESAS